MRVIICGGRDYYLGPLELNILSALHKSVHFSCIIHGGSSGVDTCAKKFGKDNKIQMIQVNADWDLHGDAALIMRNKKMLWQHPDMCVAFNGGEGTTDMINQAKQSGLFVLQISHPEGTHNETFR